MPSIYDFTKKPDNEPNYSVNFAEYGQILAIHFSPFEWSQNIILIAFPGKVLVGHIHIDETLEFEKLAEISHSVPCNTLALSPEANTSTVPKCMQFCTAGNDFALRIFKGDLSDNNTCKPLNGHSSYINDISYDPENNYLASTSDDHTTKIWNTVDYSCIGTLFLTSPGMSTCWHREDNSKLLVAEKSGIIRFYNVTTLKPILSLDYGKPLFSAHWAPSDSRIVGSLQMGELLLWDLTRPSRPIHNTLLFTEMGGHIKFSPLGELIATVSSLDGQLKVTHVQTQQQRLTTKIKLATNIAWHFRYPLVCVGDDTKLTFWRVISK